MKRMKWRWGSVLLACALSFACACGGGTDTGSPAEPVTGESVVEQPLALKNAYAGESVDVLNENLRRYLSLTDESKIATFLRARMGQDYSISQKVRIDWTGGQAPYTVKLARDTEFTQTVASNISFAQNYYFDAGLFFPGNTYFYKITDVNGNETAADSFTVAQAPRIITVSGVKNVRDIGGWETEDGHKIRYGKLFRSAHLDDITQGGKQTLLSLGIKSDLDFRTPTESNEATASPVSDLSYTRISITLFDYIFENTAKDLIRKTVEFLSDESHYPVLYHCKAGADRTGTITFLLNGLCGVSFEDLTKDFELTSFFGVGNRWRSAVQVEGGKAYFTEDGVMSAEEGNYIAWNKLYAEMMARYGTESGKLSDAIAAYLLDIGVTEAQIQAIRDILIEK